MFLSRLNEISGGCEKIVSVSEWTWLRGCEGEMWEWMECGQCFAVGGGPLEWKKQDSHVACGFFEKS